MARIVRGRRGSVGGFSRQRRKTAWTLGPGSTVVTTVSSVTPAFVGARFDILQDGVTLARMRGRLRIALRSAVSLGDNITGAFGVGVVKTTAAIAGIASVPTPVAEQDAESWLYWQAVSMGSMSPSPQWGSAGWAFFDVDIDSRAMRKLSLDDSIYAAFEGGTEVGNVTLNVFFDSRLLFMLP